MHGPSSTTAFTPSFFSQRNKFRLFQESRNFFISFRHPVTKSALSWSHGAGDPWDSAVVRSFIVWIYRALPNNGDPAGSSA